MENKEKKVLGQDLFEMISDNMKYIEANKKAMASINAQKAAASRRYNKRTKELLERNYKEEHRLIIFENDNKKFQIFDDTVAKEETPNVVNEKAYFEHDSYGMAYVTADDYVQRLNYKKFEVWVHSVKPDKYTFKKKKGNTQYYCQSYTNSLYNEKREDTKI